MKKILILLTACLLFSLYSCAGKNEPAQGNTSAPIITTTQKDDGILHDDLPDMDFNGYEFRVLSRLTDWMHTAIDVDGEESEVLNDSIYRRNRNIEGRFNFTMIETLQADENYARAYILAGDDAFDMVNARCTAALRFWKENLIYTIDDLPNINLDKPYWDHSLNPTLKLNGTQYVAVNAFNLTIYDLTQAVLFNKDMIKAYDLDNPYELVRSGNWTFDKMDEMMKQVVSDVNGDQKMDGNDQYGYLSAPKQVLPNFWIAAGVLSISKDENDKPYISMGSEKFITVFNKIFQIMWDNNEWYKHTDDTNVPPSSIEMFSAGHSLFMDTYFYYINTLRDMESDFGIIPYPKYDVAQEKYYSRVCFYDAFVIPVTNKDLDRTSAIIEALACESANTVIPAYYDVALKTKYARDNESSEMLDLIFNTRIIDLGDTVWVGEIRDGVLSAMFKTDNRNLTSKLEAMEKKVNASIEEIPNK